VVAGAGWILVSLLGALPFVMSGEIPSYIDAFFESVAGFTTTGTFALSDIELWSRSMLFWRNFIQWLGGIGVLAFVVALMGSKNGGFGMHLLRAESPGPRMGKLAPKTRRSVHYIYIVYISLSAICLGLLLAGGMPTYEAFCTMFGVAGTGGFGVLNDSMASYSSYLQTVCTIFMLLFGVNFILYPLLLRKEWRSVLKDEELRLYAAVVAGSIAVITGALLVAGLGGVGDSLHNASFMVSSVITSTGMFIGDYAHWPALARSLLFLLMIVGAMGGSTASGLKLSRVLILFRSLKAGLHRLLHPRSVKKVHLNGKPLSDEVVGRTQMFFFLYCAFIMVASLLIAVDGQALEINLSAVMACINNVGPGFGLVSSVSHFGDFSVFSKFILAIMMLVGRLEIFPILILFTPSTWRRKT